MEGEPASPGLGEDAASDTGNADAGVDSAVQMGCPPGDPVEAGFPPCPSRAPSWNSQVKAIVDTYCSPCHFNGGTGTGNGLDFSTLAGIHRAITESLTDVHDCHMPIPGQSPPLPSSNWETLLEWLACGAPDN
jgi:hypothetical protein